MPSTIPVSSHHTHSLRSLLQCRQWLTRAVARPTDHVAAHLYRTFRKLSGRRDSSEKMQLTDEERMHIAKGGYLWYNLNCNHVQRCVDGGSDDQIRAAAAAVAGVAPAYVLICVQHELDSHLTDAPPDAHGNCPARGADDCTSAANMRAVFGRVQRLFDEQGVTNTFWAVDYSTHADHTTRGAVEATWPVHREGYPNAAYPQARVDMVFFNAFLQPYRAEGDNPFLNLIRTKYAFHSTNPLYSNLPLGVGAFGIHDWEPVTDRVIQTSGPTPSGLTPVCRPRLIPSVLVSELPQGRTSVLGPGPVADLHGARLRRSRKRRGQHRGQRHRAPPAPQPRGDALCHASAFRLR